MSPRADSGLADSMPGASSSIHASMTQTLRSRRILVLMFVLLSMMKDMSAPVFMSMSKTTQWLLSTSAETAAKALLTSATWKHMDFMSPLGVLNLKLTSPSFLILPLFAAT